MLASPAYDELSSEALLASYCQERNAAVFAELVRRFECELFGYLRRLLGSAEHAEDAFQATFLQVHLKCDQYDQERPVKPWLYMIATNKAIDIKRRQARLRVVSIHGTQRNSQGDEDMGRLSETLPADQPAPHERMHRAERAEAARRALEELPEHLRLAVELVYFQGLKYREAAEVLSIPVGTVKSRINAAISRLTASWEELQSPPE